MLLSVAHISTTNKKFRSGIICWMISHLLIRPQLGTAQCAFSHSWHHGFCAPDMDKEQVPLKELKLLSLETYRGYRGDIFTNFILTLTIFFEILCSLYFLLQITPGALLSLHITVFGLRTVLLCQVWGPSQKGNNTHRDYDQGDMHWEPRYKACQGKGENGAENVHSLQARKGLTFCPTIRTSDFRLWTGWPHYGNIVRKVI